MKILNHKERKIIQDKLTEQFGIKKVPNVLVKFGEEKIFAFSGNLTLLQKLQKLTRIEGIGSYIAKEQRGEIRLSIEGSHLFKSQITKNIFKLNQEQKDLWMHGSEILLNNKERADLDNSFNSGSDRGASDFAKLSRVERGRGKSNMAKRGREEDGGSLNVRATNNKVKKGFVIMKYKDDFLGTGKASEHKIGNFIPKIRRLKERN